MAACRLPSAVFLAFGSICLGGCLPDRLVWLPDSSGFIYTAGTDRTKIVRYDVAQRASRVIANWPSQRTITPGLSPDGKQIALVRIERSKDRQTAQAFLMNQSGETIHESKVFQFGDSRKELKATELQTAAVEWSPQGDHLLIVDSDGRLGAYNTRNHTLRVLSGVRGANLQLFCFDRLVAGDGSGFLAARGTPGPVEFKGSGSVQATVNPVHPAERGALHDSKEEIHKAREPATQPENAQGNPEQPFEDVVFVDWEGRVHNLEMQADTLAALKRVFQEENLAKEKLQFFPKASWEGPVVVLPWVRGVIRIDCARRTINFERNASITAEFERIKREDVVMATQLTKGELVVQVRSMGAKAQSGNLMRIEVWIPKEAKRQTLVENVARFAFFPSIFASPDGRLAAIRYGLKDETTDRILVVDDKGTVQSNFKVE
jgi:hypothetical protein